MPDVLGSKTLDTHPRGMSSPKLQFAPTGRLHIEETRTNGSSPVGFARNMFWEHT
jgi:hypothetical protein